MPEHSRRNEQLAFEQKKNSVLITPPQKLENIKSNNHYSVGAAFFFFFGEKLGHVFVCLNMDLEV